jgi:hypothetical protein
MGFEPVIRVLQDPTRATFGTLARLSPDSVEGSAGFHLPGGPTPLTVFWGLATGIHESAAPVKCSSASPRLDALLWESTSGLGRCLSETSIRRSIGKSVSRRGLAIITSVPKGTMSVPRSPLLAGRPFPLGFPVGLSFREDPVGRLRQVPCYRTNGDGVPFAAADALVETRHVPVAPGRGMAMAGGDVGRLDKGPLEVVVGFGPHVAIAHVAGTGLDLGGGAGVTDEAIAGRKALDRTCFAIDDDAQDVADPRQGAEQLQGGGGADLLPDASFKAVDLLLHLVEQLELLLHATAGLRR